MVRPFCRVTTEKGPSPSNCLYARPECSRPLSGDIGSVRRFPEPVQQRRAYSTFRNPNPQLVGINPERSRHGFGKAFAPALDEPVIAKVAAGCFEPEPGGSKLL